jgi:hypothetical protein
MSSFLSFSTWLIFYCVAKKEQEEEQITCNCGVIARIISNVNALKACGRFRVKILPFKFFRWRTSNTGSLEAEEWARELVLKAYNGIDN